MREYLEITYGALFSQRVLLTLVEGGRSRDEAYRVVQEAGRHAWEERTPLRELLSARPELGLDFDAIFDLADVTRWAQQIVGHLECSER